MHIKRERRGWGGEEREGGEREKKRERETREREMKTITLHLTLSAAVSGNAVFIISARREGLCETSHTHTGPKAGGRTRWGAGGGSGGAVPSQG